MLCCLMLISFAVYDASVKVPTGVEYGAVYQFGNFDQCMDINSNKAITDEAEDGTDIKPQYCLADVTMNGYTVRSGAVRNFQVNLKGNIVFVDDIYHGHRSTYNIRRQQSKQVHIDTYNVWHALVSNRKNRKLSNFLNCSSPTAL